MQIADAAAFQVATNVSRETMARLVRYETLVYKWTPAINLVSKTSIAEIWHRHFLDSAQLFDIAPKNVRHWGDLGAGGGFPGLVIAAIAAERSPETKITLVESDQRKAAFLRVAAQEMGLSAQVLSVRAEDLPALGADVLSARALAPLTDLCALAVRHLAPGGVAIFPKGAKAEPDLKRALASWRFVVEKFPSKTESSAAIYKIGGISRV
ncbi:MAG: 16S rRNA (guanine(527)-N(7))-methyltransferase RsmG [Halocynthiibacter sp.]